MSIRRKKPVRWHDQRIVDHGLAISAYVDIDKWSSSEKTAYDVDGELWVAANGATLQICSDVEKAEQILQVVQNYIRHLKIAQAWCDKVDKID